MDSFLIGPVIQILQTFPAEIVSIILLGVCLISLLLLFRLFGIQGLYLYNIVAVLAANIQVLRNVQFSLSAEPVALGTVVFATTYLCSDILSEHYGKETAKKGVWICFAAQLLMTLLMIVAVGYPLLPADVLASNEENFVRTAENALAFLFTPSPRILCASLIAFAISQFNDIWVFQTLNQLTKGKGLWFRTAAASVVSSVVDTVLFSSLAWVILAPIPVNLTTLIFTYILGTLITRFIISFMATPVLYASYWFRPSALKTDDKAADINSEDGNSATRNSIDRSITNGSATA